MRMMHQRIIIRVSNSADKSDHDADKNEHAKDEESAWINGAKSEKESSGGSQKSTERKMRRRKEQLKSVKAGSKGQNLMTK